MFNSFGITNEETLYFNSQYVFTFEASYKIFGFIPGWQSSEVTVKKDLQERLQDATIISVNRGFGSGRYVIVMRPHYSYQLQYWLDVFDAIWRDAGYKSEFVTIEQGETSSQPGGLQEVVHDTVSSVAVISSDALGTLVKNLWPYLLGIAVLGAGYIYIYGKAGSTIKSNPCHKKRVISKKRRKRRTNDFIERLR